MASPARVSWCITTLGPTDHNPDDPAFVVSGEVLRRPARTRDEVRAEYYRRHFQEDA